MLAESMPDEKLASYAIAKIQGLISSLQEVPFGMSFEELDEIYDVPPGTFDQNVIDDIIEYLNEYLELHQDYL